MLYRALARPLLFALEAERAHSVAVAALSVTPLWRAASALPPGDSPRLASSLCGLELSSPLGVAAGFDKGARVPDALSSLGFAFVSVGTVTLRPRAGNPRPRLARDPARCALVNSMGFPNPGVRAAARRMAGYGGAAHVVASVSGTRVEDVAECVRAVEPVAAAVELNISSPNAQGLRAFHDPAALRELLAAVGEAGIRPLIVKLPPYDDGAGERRGAMALARSCADGGAEAVIVANTRPVADPRLAVGSGGLSGAPLLPATLRMVAETRAELGEGIGLVACGGVMSGADAAAAIRAGADAVQVYSALVYRGPRAARRIKAEMLAAMDAAGAADVAALRALS